MENWNVAHGIKVALRLWLFCPGLELGFLPKVTQESSHYVQNSVHGRTSFASDTAHEPSPHLPERFTMAMSAAPAAAIAASESRMKVTLQGFDQVIALSQAHINESLDYLFDDPTYKAFEVNLRGVGKLKGIIRPPYIKLIDKPDADQALYCIEFENGTLSWDEVMRNEQDERYFVDFKYSVKDWQLAFAVNFSLAKMANVGQDIRDKIELPGSYSVEQLVVDFGTVDNIAPNWNDSRISPLPAEASEEDVRSRLQVVVAKWFERLRTGGDAAARNVLAYAVKIDPKEGKTLQQTLRELPIASPDFPATSVRLQVINHRPGGDEKQSSPENSRNAFLFTEMTGGRAMLKKNLDWSGDLFFGAIGGSLVMSKSIFWDSFMAKRLRIANVSTVNAANEIAKKASGELGKVYGWLLSGWNNVGEGNWTSDGLESTYDWNGNETRSYEQEVGEVQNPNWLWKSTVTSNVRNVLKPISGEGRVKLTSTLTMATNVTITLKTVNSNLKRGFEELGLGVFNKVADAVNDLTQETASITITSTITLSTAYNISMRHADTQGRLTVDVSRDSNSSSGGLPDTKAKVQEQGVVQKLYQVPLIGPKLRELIRQYNNVDELENAYGKVIQDACSAVYDFGPDLEKALNGQTRFVFPGGGTFVMKDPLFNKSGDLMIGLSYRKGVPVDAAKP